MNITLLHGEAASRPTPEEENRIWAQIDRGSTVGGLHFVMSIKCKGIKGLKE